MSPMLRRSRNPLQHLSAIASSRLMREDERRRTLKADELARLMSRFPWYEIGYDAVLDVRIFGPGVFIMQHPKR